MFGTHKRGSQLLFLGENDHFACLFPCIYQDISQI